MRKLSAKKSFFGLLKNRILGKAEIKFQLRMAGKLSCKSLIP